MPSPDDDAPPDTPSTDAAETAGARGVPVAWEALEDAFENNAPDIHSYLQLETGDVLRVVDGVADPQMHARVSVDPGYLRVEPVSSREQYRWMERFIATVDPGELRDKLVQAIDGKGAFRRFKDALVTHPVDRERWFTFRTERLRACMEGWLHAHDLRAIPREAWPVPTAEDVRPLVEEAVRVAPRKPRSAGADATRRRAHEAIDGLGGRDLESALAFLEFLAARRAIARPRTGDEGDVAPAPHESASPPRADEDDALGAPPIAV